MALRNHDLTRLRELLDAQHLEIVKFLLRHGAPKSLPDDLPWATPLAWARKRGHAEIAELLS